MGNINKPIIFGLSISEQEKEIIRKASRKVSRTMSGFVRFATLKYCEEVLKDELL